MSTDRGPVLNIADAPEVADGEGHWGGPYKDLTPTLRAAGPGRLGVNVTRLPKGRVACPFHHHLREDEAFYVLSGRGVLRYGDRLYDLSPGDCVSCPAGSGVAHQIANPYDEDLVYLGIGVNDPHEVAVYPDSGKVLIRGVKRIGFVQDAKYMDGEPETPRILDLIASRPS